MLQVMAIDLGSVRREQEYRRPTGDLGFIAEHVNTLLAGLLARPDQMRTGIFGLRWRCKASSAICADPRTFAFQIRPTWSLRFENLSTRASHHWRPWMNPLSLKGFADHYNAQTLESWDVPSCWLTRPTAG